MRGRWLAFPKFLLSVAHIFSIVSPNARVAITSTKGLPFSCILKLAL
jgi:hypothetical protein